MAVFRFSLCTVLSSRAGSLFSVVCLSLIARVLWRVQSRTLMLTLLCLVQEKGVSVTLSFCQVCGKTFRTSNRWLRQFVSQGFANLHFSGSGYQLGWITKLDLTRTTFFGQIIPLCREYTLSRVHPTSRVFAAILGGTIVGPAIEVQLVKILDSHGLEIAIPSLTERASYVFDFQRKESVRGWSPYSLCRTQIQCRITQWTSKIWRRRALLRKVKCVMLAITKFVSAFLPAKRLFLHARNHSYEREKVEGYSRQFFARRSSVHTCLQNGYKNGPSLRSRWTTIWRLKTLGHGEASIAESVCKSWSTRFLREVEYGKDFKYSLASLEQFKDVLVAYQLTLSW